MGKISASVLLKLLVMKDATPLTPLAHNRNSIFKGKQQLQSMIAENQKNRYFTLSLMLWLLIIVK